MPKVTYPHLGTLYITSEHFFRALGLEPVTPPFPSRRTPDLGVKHCPEMICAPCKILSGNYYEGLELGADQLLLFGGPDTCRLGYLARPQAERLHDAGFHFTPHTLSLRGTAASEVEHTTRSFECQGCSNLCEVVEIRVGREVLGRWGGRCGKWDA